MRIKVGCCGFTKARAEYYKKLAVVELQKTFYDLPKVETAEKWRREAPPDFEFTLKAWQLITHEPSSPTYRKAKVEIKPSQEDKYGNFRPTPQVGEAWIKTKEIAQALKAKMIVFQCPARFKPTKENIDNIKTFFTSLKGEDFLYIWEPRGNWPEETIVELCKELKLVHCVDPLVNKPLWGEIGYFRLHGLGGYRYRYTDGDLAKLKMSIPQGKVCYYMFNNVYMYEDALRFKNLISKEEKR